MRPDFVSRRSGQYPVLLSRCYRLARLVVILAPIIVAFTLLAIAIGLGRAHSEGNVPVTLDLPTSKAIAAPGRNSMS